jgi:hypothetical protein
VTADEEAMPLAKILVSFFRNPENQKPDVKRLARLLRSKKPLPKGLRDALAEMLDSRLPGELACNWRLQPVFCGRHKNKAQHVNELEQIIVRKIDAARERGLTVTLAIRELADEIGKSDSSLWVIWNNHQRRRKLMEEAMRKLMEEAERH